VISERTALSRPPATSVTPEAHQHLRVCSTAYRRRHRAPASPDEIRRYVRALPRRMPNGNGRELCREGRPSARGPTRRTTRRRGFCSPGSGKTSRSSSPCSMTAASTPAIVQRRGGARRPLLLRAGARPVSVALRSVERLHLVLALGRRLRRRALPASQHLFRRAEVGHSRSRISFRGLPALAAMSA
jgi:hypothetical protein